MLPAAAGDGTRSGRAHVAVILVLVVGTVRAPRDQIVAVVVVQQVDLENVVLVGVRVDSVEARRLS